MDSWRSFLFSQAPRLMERFIGNNEAVYANLYIGTASMGFRRYHMTNLGLDEYDGMGEEEVIRTDIEPSMAGRMFQLTLLGNYQNTFIFNIDEDKFSDAANIRIFDFDSEYSHSYMDEPVEEGEALKADVWSWLEECIKMKLAADRTAIVKEQLMATAWHPDRVGRWLAAGVAIEDM